MGSEQLQQDLASHTHAQTHITLAVTQFCAVMFS